MRDNPKPMQRYRHFKGNMYQVLTLAKDSETLEDVVVYQALYGNYEIYVRPLTMFMSKVDRSKYPDASQTFRFEEVCADAGENTQDHACIKDTGLGDTGIADTNNAEAGMTVMGSVDTDIADKSASDTDDSAHSLDSAVIQFLDADTYGKRLNILASLKHRITDDMITTMAMALDLEVEEGPVELRYEQLKNCLIVKEKYECIRRR